MFSFLLFRVGGGLALVCLIILIDRLRSRDRNASSAAVAYSRDDAFRQLGTLLAVILFGEFIYAIAQSIGDVSGETALLVTALTAVSAGYYFRSYLPFLFGWSGMLSWSLLQFMAWMNEGRITGMWQFTGPYLLALLLLAVSHLHRGDALRQRARLTALSLGLFLTLLGLVYMSSRGGLLLLMRGLDGPSLWSNPEALAFVCLTTIGIVGVETYAALRGRIPLWMAVTTPTLAALFIGISALPAQVTVLNGTITPTGALWALLLNAVLAIPIGGLIASGHVLKEEWRKDVGSVLLGMFLVVKFFEYLWSAMDASIAFIVAGLLLLGLGMWFEMRGRKTGVQPAA